MTPDIRFSEHISQSEYPVLTLARLLNLEGSTLYVVSEDGIHEGTFKDQQGEDIVFLDAQTNEEAKVHASKVHLFLRDAEHHFRVLSHETNWGVRSGNE